jgi:hypothetical protein
MTVRLLRICNPWGKREWKGEWSVNSEKWTTALRNKLAKQSFAKGDGTFFMAFGDVLHSFHHMDVAKCHQGWKYASIDGMFSCEATDPLVSSQQVYCLNVSKRTWAFISVIQPKKRANTKTQYWYSDLSMVILKRPRGTDDDWSCEDCIVQGCSRCCSCKILLDPSNEYVCVPFSHGAPTCGSLQDNPFRVTLYSSSTVCASPKQRMLKATFFLRCFIKSSLE